MVKDGMHQVRINGTSTGAVYRLYSFSGLTENVCDLHLLDELLFLDPRSWQYACVNQIFVVDRLFAKIMN
jgi:hypothetical protein